MRIDIRLVIGVAFLALGALLTLYGALHQGEPQMQPTGLPITLLWGVVMLAFGAFMTWLARRARG